MVIFLTGIASRSILFQDGKTPAAGVPKSRSLT